MIRSEQFDDIYFSAEDGLAESRHVYLAGNNLPDAWAGRDQFTILELGFGTGLNFLATLQAWQQTAGSGQQLRYVSVEKYPLALEQMQRALAHWPELSLAALEKTYPQGGEVIQGVTLELHIGDVMDILPQLNIRADALYLDGFAPAKNPDMWSRTVTDQLARLSHIGTTLATFTVASAVRANLTASGFAAQKAGGYGRKRDMLVGAYTGSHGAARD